MTFAQKLYELKGWDTQSEMAEKMPKKFPVRTLQEWMQGKRTPPPWVQELVLERLKKERP